MARGRAPLYLRLCPNTRSPWQRDASVRPRLSAWRPVQDRIKAQSELRCFGMTSWDFRPLVESNASIAWKMLQVMAQRLKEAEAR